MRDWSQLVEEEDDEGREL